MSMPTSKKEKKSLVLNVVLEELTYLGLGEDRNFLDGVYVSIEDAVYDRIPTKTGYFSDLQLKKANTLIKELQKKTLHVMYRAVESELRRLKAKKKTAKTKAKRKNRQ